MSATQYKDFFHVWLKLLLIFECDKLEFLHIAHLNKIQSKDSLRCRCFSFTFCVTWDLDFSTFFCADTQTSTAACCGLHPRQGMKASRMSSGAEDGGVSVINFLGALAPVLQSLFLSFSIRSKHLPPPLQLVGFAVGVSSLIWSPVLPPACPCNLTAGRLAVHLLSAPDFSFTEDRKEPNVSQD